jgi:serine/threonine-protein kinase
MKHLPDGPFDRLTFEPGLEIFPAWSPNGADIIYSEGGQSLWRRAADGTGAPELLLRASPAVMARWSPDGTRVVFSSSSGAPVDPGAIDILWFRPGVDSAATRLIGTPTFIETLPAISPDGRWIAYATNESGEQPEVYVRPFPNVDAGRVRVSTAGGDMPLWSRSGSELFFVDTQRNLVAAEVDGRATTFTVRARRTLFTIDSGIIFGADGFDISTDDQRFLMARRTDLTGAPQATFVLVQNWFPELRRLSPN